MRTKHLLTALMLPAVFAACTQEEYDVVDNSAKMNERIELGQIALDFGGAESRFAAGTGNNFNGFVPEDGDVLGAALVDNAGASDDALVYNKAGVAAHKGLYNLTSSINTNYAYEKNGSSWESAANMVEGNYLFYLPYNASHTVRTPLVAKLPVTQTLEVANGEVVKESLIDYALEQNSIMALGYTFIDRDDAKQVAVKMLPVYAYPLVKLVNTYKEDITPDDNKNNPVGVDVTIKQIIVKNSNNFTVSAPIYVGNGTKSILTATDGAVKELNRKFTYRNADNDANVTVANGSYAAYDVEGQNYEAFTSNLLGDATATSPAVVVKPTERFTIEAGEATEFYLVIPAEDYKANTLTIEVTTNKGTFAKTIANPAIAAGKRYPLAEYVDGELTAPVEDPDGSLAIAAGKGSEYCVKLGENTHASSSIMVTSTADLVAELQNAVDETSLNVTSLSKDVCFDAAVARAFKANKKQYFNLTINGEITLTSGLISGTVDTKSININDKAYINGNITINDQIEWGVSGNANSKTVVEVVAGNVTVASMGSLHGQMSIKSDATVTVQKNTVPFGIVNAGTLNVLSDVDLKSNTGTVNVGDGTATSTNGKGITLTWEYNFANAETGTVNVYAHNSVNYLNNAGTVNNYGAVTGLVNAATGTVNNYGAVTGENVGLIDLKSVNASVTAETGNGRIKNNIDINAKINKATMENQKVYFEYVNQQINGALYPTTGQYNTIVLENTTWSPTASQDLTGVNKATLLELKGATISVYVPGTEITLPDLYVYNANSYIKGNSEAIVYYGEVTGKTEKLSFVGVNAIQVQ